MTGGYDLSEYSRVRLHSRPVPDDLRIMLRMERDRVVDEDAYAAMKLDEPKPAVDPEKLRDELSEAELARRRDGAR